MVLTAFPEQDACHPTEEMLARYQTFVDLLAHPNNYQSADAGSYSGYHQRQMQFQVLKDMRTQQQRGRTVQRNIGRGEKLLTEVDLAAIQGFQKEAWEAMLDYRRHLDSQAASTPEYFPEVPAGWTGTARQADRVVITAACIENRIEAKSAVVLTNTIEARPFQRQDPEYLLKAEQQLLQQKQKAQQEQQEQTKGKKSAQISKDAAAPPPSQPLTLDPSERLNEQPEPLLRDTTSFAPTPYSLILQRLENLQRLRNSVNIVILHNRAQKGLRQIQKAYADFLPLYAHRHQQEAKHTLPLSHDSQQWRLAELIFQRQCKGNALSTYNELLALSDKSHSLTGHNGPTEQQSAQLSFDNFLSFTPPPLTNADAYLAVTSGSGKDAVPLKMSRTIPELMFYTSGCRSGCNSMLRLDSDEIKEEQTVLVCALI